MPDYYILDEQGTPVLTDVMAWAHWFQAHTTERVVAQTRQGDVSVSTVFLGMDHNYMGESPTPLLYETLVFGGPHDGRLERYSTSSEALDGHDAMVREVLGEARP